MKVSLESTDLAFQFWQSLQFVIVDGPIFETPSIFDGVSDVFLRILDSREPRETKEAFIRSLQHIHDKVPIVPSSLMRLT